MDCWARINGKDYPIAYEWTLEDEFSESLDSATIRIPHAYGLHSIKSYDDVIIHDYDPNGEEPLPNRPFGQVFVPENGHFYRHMIVSSRNIEEVSIEPIEGKKRYNYSIDLRSETGALEKVQLPNKTISQPMGTGNGEYKPSEASFTLYNKTFKLPYGVAEKWYEGAMPYSLVNVEAFQYTQWFVSLFVGDGDSATFDYSSFTSMPSFVKSEEPFTLPDWYCSGVSAIYGVCRYNSLIPWSKEYEIIKSVFVNPVKHWIIRKLGTNDEAWGTRTNIIKRIRRFLEAAKDADEQGVAVVGYDEIVNYQAYGKNDIASDKKTNQLKATLTLGVGESSAQYECYIYIEPVRLSDIGINPPQMPLDNDANIFGMTDISNGIKPPTRLSEFLVHWPFSLVTSALYNSAGALSVAEAVRQAVEIYSPYVKVTDDGHSWRYVRKFSIDPKTMDYMSAFIAPENQWNAPNLRDFITRLFYVADCIPVVHDGVISHMNLAQRKPQPFTLRNGQRSYANNSMDGSSYCDRLIREYDDGLSNDNVCDCYERIGFKNMDSPTLTLDNMRLELSHPIYRIKKVYMCYYDRYYNQQGVPVMRLTKQDITPLVILNERRNLLSEDWSTLENIETRPSNITELAKFKYATIGYSIGDTNLSGWGTKYSHPTAVFWTTTKSVIENIYDFVISSTPFGVTNPLDDFEGYYKNGEIGNNAADFLSPASEDREATIEDPVEGVTSYTIQQQALFGNDIFKKFFGNFTQRLKTMMFEISYQGYVSASVLASKDRHDGNVVSRDNASSSLSFVESDGINQKEKANRLGNETITVSARHKAFSDIQDLAQVWDEYDDDGNKTHDDEVLFKRTITFGKDYFSVSYYLCKNYVLRNYFTSVFSRHRPFALSSYEQSVLRKENKTMQVLLSSSEWYWQNQSKRIGFSYDVPRLFSFFKQSEYDSDGNLVIENGINSFHYVVYPSKSFQYSGQCGVFCSDSMKFVSGNSLCFVVKMKDSVSAGTFVSDFNNTLSMYVGSVVENTLNLALNSFETSNDMIQATHMLTGAKQDWHMFPIDPRTGMMYSMSFGVGFKENDVYGTSGFALADNYNIAQSQLLPLMDAVLKRAEGDTPYIYFGAHKDDNSTKLVGSGFPNLIFKENNGKYYADMSQRNFLHSYSDWVYESNVDFSSDPNIFETYGGVAIPERNLVTEFVSAKFVGRETETSDETDTCVFKDGKERMCVTMQIEPISAEDAIQFSPYMMKLSDVMGGKGKNYEENDVTQSIVFKYGISLINAKEIVAATPQLPMTAELLLLSVPSLTIGIPIGFSLSDYPDGLEINETFVTRNKLDTLDLYKIYVKKISFIDEANGILLAVCNIYLNGTLVYIDEEVPFYNRDIKNGIIRGASTQDSDLQTDNKGYTFDANVVCYPLSNDKYVSYTMCDDRFFGTNEMFYRHDLFLRKIKYFNYSGASGALAIQSSTTEDIFDIELDYTQSQTKWQSYNYSKVFYYQGYNIRYDGYSVFTSEVGPVVGNLAEKSKNMFWVLSTTPVDKSSPYESLTKKPDNYYSPSEFVPDQNISVVQESGTGLWKISILLPEAIGGNEGASLRLYYRENETYHFVFGVNLGVVLESEILRRPNFIYPVGDDGRRYEIYLSFLDDRSKTVIDGVSGDPLYKVINWANAEEISATGADISNPSNICIEK